MSLTNRKLSFGLKTSIFLKKIKWIPIFVLCGILFVLFTVSREVDWQEVRYLRSEVGIGDGTIDKIYRNYNEDGEVSAYEYVYTFHSPWGDKQWSSFSSKAKFKVQEPVEIEYSLENPDIHRIKGLTNTKSEGKKMGLIFILITICIAGLIYYLYSTSRIVKVIEQGLITKAKLTNIYNTNITINEEPVFKFEFTFKGEDQKNHLYSLKKTNRSSFNKSQKYPICYLPDSPTKAILLLELPQNLAELMQPQ
ncbi:hypothetical protein [Persicobacter diffluens]|uniref:DUF3592 domain-containing protein n=1 Tax=Persicobacter diffluens TaxID=981 RepID=A0AAN5ALJ6_9BACT|nr:hypothetical protein PEDI_14950 [Persicobacter diffluens]